MGSPSATSVSVSDAAALVIAELARRRCLAPQSEARVVGLIRRFADFVTLGRGMDSISEVCAADVVAFATASTMRTGSAPSPATMRLRRWALRCFFRIARELGLVVANDPTVDVALPSRTPRSVRPLTTVEVEQCRRASLHNLVSTRLSVAWALGEATARTSEVPHLRVEDLDLDAVRVWIHGSRLTTPRWGALTEWGVRQVQRRLKNIGTGATPELLLAEVGAGNPESQVSFSAQALRETIARAGLAAEERVSPGSVAAWAGVQIFQATGHIDAVAYALGVRSLDAAARLIDWDWRTESDDAHA
jgi:integrase/recombinase XerC